MTIAGFATHNPGMISGGLWAELVCGLIAAIEIPLVIHAAARQRQKLVATSPPGTLYAARVTQLASPGSVPAASSPPPSRGLLRLSATGVDYQPTHAGSPSVPGAESFPWIEVDIASVVPRTPIRGRFEITTHAGSVHRWSVPGTQEVVQVLNKLERAAAAGAHEVLAETTSANKAAQGLLRSLGFGLVATDDGKVRGRLNPARCSSVPVLRKNSTKV